MDYLEGDRRVQDLTGYEIIEFVGTAWRVDAIYELAGGDYRVECEFDDRKMSFEVPYDQHIQCLLPDDGYGA